MDSDSTQEWDLVVVGGGLAGMLTATRSAIEGLRVLVLEQSLDDHYFCNSRLTGGIFHLHYHSVFDDEAKILAAIGKANQDVDDDDLLRSIVADAKRAVSWLESVGVRFMRDTAGWIGDTSGWRSHVLAPPPLRVLGRAWQGRGGDMALQTLEGRLGEHGGTVRRGHRAKRLIVDGGRVVGVEVSRALRKPISVRARAVVIADGGFQANRDEIARHVTQDPEQVVQRNAGTGQGDGIRMAREAGAAITPRGSFYGHLLSRDALTNDQLWPYPYMDEIARIAIVVGADARRVADEGLGGVYLANALARLQEPASTTLVFDQAGWEGPGRQRAISPNPVLVQAGATLHTARTLGELATQCGLPGSELVAEVALYNSALSQGLMDTLEPPRTTRLHAPMPIVEPPFYGIPLAPGITYTMGGIRIDRHSRALDTSGRPVPGLYAAGSATGGIEGGPSARYVGGLACAATTGLHAAEHISGIVLGAN
jgi:fumarate reductase flavoprotein subunit